MDLTDFTNESDVHIILIIFQPDTSMRHNIFSIWNLFINVDSYKGDYRENYYLYLYPNLKKNK